MSLSVGERLKSAREAKRISLDEACRVTKIQKRVLEAIEQNQVEDILDPAYVKIFLKKYAGYLGIDGSTLLQEYLAVNHPSHAEPAIAVRTEVTQERERSSSFSQTVATVAVIVAALVGVAFLGYLSVDLLVSTNKGRSAAISSSGAPARPKPEPKRDLLVPAAKPLQLTIHTTADVWLQVKADGSVIFQNVLSKGAKESWTAKKELELWTGNAGAMQLALNGKPLEGIGRGVRKGVRITHAGIESP